MDLTKCADCENEVSKHANVCPHCGCVYKAASVFSDVFWAIILSSIILGVGYALLCLFVLHNIAARLTP